MDNIFEILIYLFIIISFISSFFKKKKKPEPRTTNKTDKISFEPETQAKSPQQEEYDLLKEIEKMFKTETSYPEKQQERSIDKVEGLEPASEHLKTADWHQPTASEHKPTASEQKFESWEEKNRKAEEKRKGINKKIVQQAQMFEKRLTGKQRTESEIRKNIMKKFKDPKSLKEYIIFSEILGKPKSLQE